MVPGFMVPSCCGTCAGKEGHGRLKVMQAASKVQKKPKQLTKAQARKAAGQQSAFASGTASSLAFSHVQGIELENPNREDAMESAHVGQETSGTESYFSELSGFRTLRKL